MLVITCKCGQRMKGPPSLLGRTVKCVRCGAQVVVTKKNAAPLPDRPADQAGEAARKESAAPSGAVRTQDGKRLGEVLIGEGLITREQLNEALAVQEKEGGRILQILLSSGLLDKTTLHDFLSKRPGIASIDLRSYYIPRDLISLVPKQIAQESLVLPIDKLGRLLTVGMVCPLDQETIARLEHVTGLTVKPMLCKLDDILITIDRYYPIEHSGETQQPSPGPHPAPAEPVAPPRKEAKRPESEPGREPAAVSAPAASTRPVVPLQVEIIDRFVRLEALPTFLDTVKRVRQALQGEAGNVRALMDVVSIDPPVIAKLLSVANAAPYGMPGQVTDVNLAAVLLGIDGVCEIAMLSEIAGNNCDTQPLDFASYARCARFCGTAAGALATATHPRLRHIAYAAGLLHSIGSLALATAFPKRAAEINGTTSAQSRIEDEIHLFGMGHPEAGALFLKEWGLPEIIADTVRLHRDIAAAAQGGPLASIVALAAILNDSYAQNEPDASEVLIAGQSLLDGLALPAGQVLATYEETVAALDGN